MNAGPSGRPTVGVLGGTGPQGRGLALRLGLAGVPVVLGSRNTDRAAAAAAELRARGGDLPIQGVANATAATAELVVVAVPWAGHAELLAGLASQLAGRIVVDCVNPLRFDRLGAHPLDVPEGSAAEQAARLLTGSRVVAAFHHVSAVALLDLSRPRVDCDVLVLGDDREATDRVQQLADRIPGLRGVYAGPLRLAAAVEGLTANLVSVNRRYRAHAGVRITDVG